MNVVDFVLMGLYIVTLYYTVFWLVAFIDYAPPARVVPRRLPKVSVVIPAYNEEGSLERSARSVLALDYPPNLLELVIVDDGSSDRTLAVAERIMASERRVKVVSQPNGGKWKAMNAGIRASSGGFVACLDADSVVMPDALVKMLPHFSDERVAVVLPMLYVEKPGNLLQKVQWYEYVINMFYRRVAGLLNCIHVTPGPFSVYRRDVLERIGGFREGYATEDLEICLRLQSMHYKIVQVSNAEVLTEAPASFSELYRQRLRWNLGSTLNILSYRRMLFNPRYGDFGVFQLPIIFFATFFAVALLLITFYLSMVKPNVERFIHLWMIDFDLLSLIRSWKFSFSFLDFDYFRLFIALSFFLVSVAFIVMAHRSVKHKVTAQGLPALLAFMFMYYLFLGYVRLVVIKDILLRKRFRW